jgi:metallophosphoesterase (TIGR00282 family)
MRILYVAEPVGKAGLFTLRHTLGELKQEFRPDFVWGGGDGATGGFGLGKNHAHYLHKLGLQAITLGDCAYYKKDLHPALPELNFLLRPANFPDAAPGRGFRVFSTRAGRLAVVSLLGQSGFSKVHLPNPLATLETVLAQLDATHVVVDYHAATTAEKATLFHWADGRVTAVVGSHQKTPTADARVLPRGTAVVTDAGRTGSVQSVGGFTPHKEIERLLTGVPSRSDVAWAALTVQGVFIETDETGRARSIQSFQRSCKEVPHESADNQNGNDQED